MPGTVMPREMESIAEFLGEEYSNAFVQKYFVASDGPEVAKQIDGEWVRFRIPTIVPRIEGDACVFLKDERCSIHEVAPFGCAYHDTHAPDEEGHRRSEYCLQIIAAAHARISDYTRKLMMLVRTKRTAPPLAVRKAKYLAGIEAAEASVQQVADSEFAEWQDSSRVPRDYNPQ